MGSFWDGFWADIGSMLGRCVCACLKNFKKHFQKLAGIIVFEAFGSPGIAAGTISSTAIGHISLTQPHASKEHAQQDSRLNSVSFRVEFNMVWRCLDMPQSSQGRPRRLTPYPEIHKSYRRAINNLHNLHEVNLRSQNGRCVSRSPSSQ